MVRKLVSIDNFILNIKKRRERDFLSPAPYTEETGYGSDTSVTTVRYFCSTDKARSA